jgi:hypothetical protein
MGRERQAAKIGLQVSLDKEGISLIIEFNNQLIFTLTETRDN